MVFVQQTQNSTTYHLEGDEIWAIGGTSSRSKLHPALFEDWGRLITGTSASTPMSTSSGVGTAPADYFRGYLQPSNVEIIETSVSSTLPRIVSLGVQAQFPTQGRSLSPNGEYEYLAESVRYWDALRRLRITVTGMTLSNVLELSRQGAKAANMPNGGEVIQDEAARALVRKYGISRDVDELYYRIMDQSVSRQPVKSISITADTEWNNSKPRVLMTIYFAGGLAEAVDSWLAIYDSVVRGVNQRALDEEKLAFHFDVVR